MIDIKTIKNGIICFTFDDRNFDGWINAMPLFEKYNAHASFFVSGEMDDVAINTMKALASNGHTVGLHTLEHMDAPEFFEKYGGEKYYEQQIKAQLEKCQENGLNVKSFAYPNNRRNDETDTFLEQYFCRFRAGVRNANETEIYIPVDEIFGHKIMHGFGIGEYYKTTESELIDKIKRIADENICVTFFSHDIKPNAEFINIPIELLEKCLITANELGVRVIGFDEI